MIRRLTVPLLASLGLLVALAVPAAAHVTVSAESAGKGSFSVLTFHVPTEKSDADTTALKVQFPPDHPIAFVSVQPKDGWTFKVKNRKLDNPLKTADGSINEAVSEIDWSGGKIAPGEFDMFNVSAGPLPDDTDSLTFKAIQTYTDADGKTSDVAWIQEAAPGQPEPDHPAPVLKLTAAQADQGQTAMTTPDAGSSASNEKAPATPSVTATTTDAKSSSGGSDTTALAIGIAGLVIAIIALVIALTRKPKSALTTDLGAQPSARPNPN